MILSIALSCILLTKAHELAVPEHDEFTMTQLYELYSGSHGIVKKLPDKAFTAIDWHPNNPPSNVRIGSTKYWEGGQKGLAHQITVDLTSLSLVTGIATEGVSLRKFVTKYTLMTSKNGRTWKAHGSFVGNFDMGTMCKNYLDEPVFARFVKLTVLDFSGCPCMRLDVLVYDGDGYY